ncbi:GDSL esterase/lipase [Cardamine amara subsp. amara]|uniref:GDSL esterase/lipase n=1 Tax=Cardamine amara subsp. amara TaxID=228776 RepID=A0ABD0ZTG1_CARAN
MFVRSAKELGVKLPCLWRTHGKKKLKLDRGMNFAFGRSEVFDSPTDRSPNISTQVGFLVNLALARRVYTTDGDLTSSYALLSYSGSDYYGFIDENPKIWL